MNSLLQDLRYGVRSLGQRPSFTIVAVLTLALGIGANTAVFSIVNDVILTPLATEDADRLVNIIERHEQGWGNPAWSTFVDIQKESQSFTSLAQHATQSTTVLGADRPLRATMACVSRRVRRGLLISASSLAPRILWRQTGRKPGLLNFQTCEPSPWPIVASPR